MNDNIESNELQNEEQNEQQKKLFKIIADLGDNIEEIKPANLFKVQTGNKWMEDADARPIPKMLFSEFWYESELCILFADTNVGKSILAVCLADSISRGVPMPGFKLEAEPQPVLYFDFELGDKQFQNRYSKEYKESYKWSPNFYRAEIDAEDDMPEEYDTYEDYINHSLEASIIKSNAKILIIDNITYLRNETERAKDALPLMKHLKHLKKKYGLSILVLAHTPKRDPSKPITRNDLQGSKMLINFCDSAFALGESCTDKLLRYIKQIKQRNCELLYGADNVILAHVVKPDNFLKLEFIGYGKEWEHLKEKSIEDENKQKETILQLKGNGNSIREIAVKLGLSSSKVHRVLKEIENPRP